MERKGKKVIQEMIQKIGAARLIIIVLAGVMLLVLSVPSDKEETLQEETSSEKSGEESAALSAMVQYAKKQEQKTKEILSKVEGIGEVEVMITLASSEEKITLQDDSVTKEEVTQSDQTGADRKDETYQSSSENVIIKRDDEESPYVVQIQSPVIEGVVVVAQGADSGQKKTEIIEAIQALFPVQAHKIKVMKME